LNKQERAEVSSLSRWASPTPRRVSFSYNVDGYDIPGGYEKLMEKYYDVMYSESYAWWTLALAFNTSPEQIVEIKSYQFYGEEDAGVRINTAGNRVIIEIICRINPSFFLDSDHDYEDEDEDEVSVGTSGKGAGFVAEDRLLNLLIQVRQQLINKDYRTLYAVYEQYGYPEEEEEYQAPVPKTLRTGKNIVDEFKNMLAAVE
jgi:hypothetical protein